MVVYQIPSLDPELTVAVGWEPLLGSFVGRVEGVPTGALLDPDRRVVAWFGSRQGELHTVEDLQDAIGEYAVLRHDIRVALEADRAGCTDEPPSTVAAAPLRLVTSNSRPDAERPQARAAAAAPERRSNLVGWGRGILRLLERLPARCGGGVA